MEKTQEQCHWKQAHGPCDELATKLVDGLPYCAKHFQFVMTNRDWLLGARQVLGRIWEGLSHAASHSI